MTYRTFQKARGPTPQKRDMTNTTIETLTLWDAAIKSSEKGDYKTSIETFSKIPQPSAKILFNIGSAHLKAKNFSDSLQVRMTRNRPSMLCDRL